MRSDNLILISTICECYRLDYSFIDQLEQHGMVEIIYREDTSYLDEEHLSLLEKIIRIHHDLQVNIEGIAVIIDLIDRIDLLQQENKTLRRKIEVH
ncbi:MAG: MerR family transcriptional regulator [Saprospiraceae bacterium]|nr:MerR family transcriptional regulator [Saprospiraceae bacterium]